MCRGARSTRFPSSEPADSSWIGAEAGGKTVQDKESAWGFCLDARPASYSEGTGNYSSRLRAAKATQKRDCPATKGTLACSCLPLLQYYPTQTTRTQGCWRETTINLTFSLFLPVMKRTEQWPMQSPTKHIWIPNTEQNQTLLGRWASRQASKLERRKDSDILKEVKSSE